MDTQNSKGWEFARCHFAKPHTIAVALAKRGRGGDILYWWRSDQRQTAIFILAVLAKG